ncbi:MAG: Protein YceI [Syntrophorhabdaceae bacterium]|nr:Protein YceI [Syntrophorhabdaceae bacterium]
MSNACAVTLDGRNTSVAFAVRWWGLLAVRGHFPDVSGELIIPNGDISTATMRLEVDAGSVRTGIGLRDRHLRGPQFLDAAHYPRITFSSTRVERVDGAITVTGHLSLRGAQRVIVARCPLGYAEGEGIGSTVAMASTVEIPRLPHGVGSAEGMQRLNPLLAAISDRVVVSVRVLVPASRLLPALLPALGR